MRGSERIPRRYYRYAAIVLCVLFLVFAGLFCLRIWEKSQDDYPEREPVSSFWEYDGTKYQKKDSVETFLLIGLDKMDDPAEIESYNNDKQADFLLLLVMDHATESYAAVQINRDTMVPVNVLGVAGNTVGTSVQQIALAHTYGNGKEVSCRNTADSVSALLQGVKIDHYLSMTMDAIPVVNDLCGGVTVTLLDDFTHVDPAMTRGAEVNLMGNQALAYVQARQGMEEATNVARMQRQQQYMGALREKLGTRLEQDEGFIVDASLQMADYIVNDGTPYELQKRLEKLSTYSFDGFLEIAGETQAGEQFAEFYADTAAVEELVAALFYEPVK